MVVGGVAGASSVAAWGAFNVIQCVSLQNSLTADMPSNVDMVFNTMQNLLTG